MIHIWVPFLPPSSNNIYVKRPAGGRMLSQKARTFKVRAMQVIQKEGRVAFLHLKEEVPYELKLSIFFEAVLNKGYPDKAKTKFKRIDIGNRLKLIEDTVSDALGLDDCHNFRIILEKHCDLKNPGLYIDLKEVDNTEVALTKEQYDERHRLRQDKQHRTRRSVSPAWLSTSAHRTRKGHSPQSSEQGDG
jgi:Holliday junction resolvase RusA-like endonuclease